MTPEKARILLIDDDELVLTSIRQLLVKKGYAVQAARSPAEALNQVYTQEFDLVISDVRMPGQSGIEVVEKIKNSQKENGKESAFMFITGFADEDAPQHAARLGIPEFILKPFEIDLFLNAVERQLEIFRANASPPIEPPPEKESLIGRWKFPSSKFVMEKTILLKNTNLMGNTYYDNYITWQGEARESLLLSHPNVKAFLQAAQSLKMVTHSVYQRFFAETTFGDTVRIEATSREVKRCSFILVFRYFDKATGMALGEGWQKICFVDMKTGKLCQTPQLILDLIEPLQEKEEKKIFQTVSRDVD